MPLEIEDLMESRDFLDFLFDKLTSAIFLVDKNIKIKKINNSFQSLFSKSEREVLEELCGNGIGCIFTVEENKSCGSTSRCGSCTIRECLTKSFDNNKKELFKTKVSRKFNINGKSIPKHFLIKVRNIQYNKEYMAVVVVDDITEMEEQKKKIRKMAITDYLTGLYNRRYFYEISKKIVENAVRSEKELAVAMIDIDKFKNINDTYGHDCGDFILKKVAEIFSNNIGKGDILSRFGGEEFCILLNNKDSANALSMIEKLRLIIEKNHFIYHGETIHVTISSGLAYKKASSLDRMIKNADLMLYQAKENGRNQTVMEKE